MSGVKSPAANIGVFGAAAAHFSYFFGAGGGARSGSQLNNITTNYDIGFNLGNKEALKSKLKKLRYFSLVSLKKKMASFICPLINSEGLLWWRVRLCTQQMCANSFPPGLQRKTSLLWYGPHVGRLHLLFITSWLYFSSKFQAGVQSAKKPSLCVCVYMCE